MSDTNETPESEGGLQVTAHLDFLGEGEAVVETVAVGLPTGPETIILRADANADGLLTLDIRLSSYFATMEGIDVLGVIAQAFDEVAQRARPDVIERLIQPTEPEVGEAGTEPSA